MEEAIHKDIALQLCEEIREENARKKFGSGKMMCWGCIKATKDNIEGRCVFANELNRGCSQVNKRYDKLYKKR
ncbi:MAG: hypothetical protein ACETWM_22380 [Candidatus Lokiarchaeia archaeon]